MHEEFAKKFSYSSAMLLPFLFSSIDEKVANDSYYVKVVKVVNKFRSYFTARVDIKLMTTEGDFQILSVSDKKATVQKPAWFQKNGIGYVIQSHLGQLDFTAKATVDGKIRLWLRGLDVRAPEDLAKGIRKLIPYWIDYTKLTVDEETIFDTLTPVWHDKFYTHIIDVKADKEIKIQVEWLPHRSDNQ